MEGSFNDSSQSGWNAFAETNATLSSLAWLGEQSVNLDGTPQTYLSTTGTGSSTDWNGSFSGCAWIFPTASQTDDIIFGTTNAVNANKGWIISFAPSTSTTLRLRANDGGGVSTVNSTNQVTLNTWSHTCFSFNHQTGEARLFIDGKFEDSGTLSTGGFSNPSNPLGIGGTSDSGSTGTRYFDGSIDEVAIWNDALTDTEISISIIFKS